MPTPFAPWAGEISQSGLANAAPRHDPVGERAAGSEQDRRVVLHVRSGHNIMLLLQQLQSQDARERKREWARGAADADSPTPAPKRAAHHAPPPRTVCGRRHAESSVARQCGGESDELDAGGWEARRPTPSAPKWDALAQGDFGAHNSLRQAAVTSESWNAPGRAACAVPSTMPLTTCGEGGTSRAAQHDVENASHAQASMERNDVDTQSRSMTSRDAHDNEKGEALAKREVERQRVAVKGEAFAATAVSTNHSVGNKWRVGT